MIYNTKKQFQGELIILQDEANIHNAQNAVLESMNLVQYLALHKFSLIFKTETEKFLLRFNICQNIHKIAASLQEG